MHAPGVQRRREKSAPLPFEGLLGPVLVPHGSLAFAVENVDRFFEHVALRIGAGARSDFAKVRAIRGFRAFEIDDGPFGAETLPGLEFGSGYIGNEVTC